MWEYLSRGEKVSSTLEENHDHPLIRRSSTLTLCAELLQLVRDPWLQIARDREAQGQWYDQ